MKEKILELRKSGLAYSKIAEILNCTKSLVCYYCGKNQKNKSKNRQTKRRKNVHPYQLKLEAFINKKKSDKNKNYNTSKKHPFIRKLSKFITKGNKMNIKYNIDDVINKFTNTPKCYLTGDPININEPYKYHFDHKTPSSKGGDNSLENMGICTKEANMAKNDMTEQEFLELCKKVLINHGYSVIKEDN
jgi:predicted transcriptional regulator